MSVCAAPTCSHQSFDGSSYYVDVDVCDNPYDLQIHVNQAVNYSDTHRYKL